MLLVFGARCQLRLLSGQEHGRTLPSADIEECLAGAGAQTLATVAIFLSAAPATVIFGSSQNRLILFNQIAAHAL